MWLLDTMVISELRKKSPTPQVMVWLSMQAENDLFLSVVTISEIQRGIAGQRRKDAVFARSLQQWLEILLRNFDTNILTVTPAIALRWGELSAAVGHDGSDIVIAATALEHNLSVVTRNEKHFAPLGVKLLNPYQQ